MWTKDGYGSYAANLAKPAQRALVDAGYSRLDRLSKVTEADLLELHGMGPKALGQLREALAARGLRFKTEGRGADTGMRKRGQAR